MKLITLVGALLLSTNLYAQDTSAMLEAVRAARATYPASMDRSQVAEMLNKVAYEHPGWGLLRKGAGNSCPLRDTNISCDILIHKASIVHYDVLRDAENTAEPVFNSVGPCVLGPSSGCDMRNYLDPYPVAGDKPPSEPTDPSTPPASEELEARIAEVLANVQALRNEVQLLSQQTERQYADVLAHLALLPSTPTVPAIGWPIYRGSIFGVNVVLRPDK